jgi:hypothetical protein
MKPTHSNGYFPALRDGTLAGERQTAQRDDAYGDAEDDGAESVQKTEEEQPRCMQSDKVDHQLALLAVAAV